MTIEVPIRELVRRNGEQVRQATRLKDDDEGVYLTPHREVYAAICLRTDNGHRMSGLVAALTALDAFDQAFAKMRAVRD